MTDKREELDELLQERMNIPPIKVMHGQDQGEVVGWTHDNVLVLFLGADTPEEIPADELRVIQGNARFDAMRRNRNV